MNSTIMNISEICIGDIDAFGKKIVNLALVKKLGMNVPNGFGIPAQFFQEYCIYNEIITEDLNSIQQKISDGNMPKDLYDGIYKMWELLSKSCDNPFIVRSSALEEDGESNSFAGVYSSVMGIKNIHDLIEGIKLCWCSYFSESAISYRRINNYNLNGLGVLVQEMVDGEVSGVMFTSNPISGDLDEIVIESLPGLNFVVVDGIMPADRYTVNKQGKIINESINEKKIKYVLSKETGNIETVSIPEKERLNSTIDHRHIYELVNNGIMIEEYFSKPYDIEWTIKVDKIYILQARPITAKKNSIDVEADFFDSNITCDIECNLLDRYSEPACACYLSLLKRWEEEVYIDFYSRTEGKYHSEKPLLFFFNRVYWNLKYQREFFDDIPFGDGSLTSIKKKFKFIRLMLSGYKNWYGRLDRYDKYIAGKKSIDLKLLGNHEIYDLLEDVLNIFCNYIGKDHYQFLGMANVCYNLLMKELSAISGISDVKETITNVLSSKISENMTMKSNVELIDMANKAAECEEIKEIFLNNSADEIYSLLGRTDKIIEFKKLFDSFIKSHGHRGTSCDDLLTPHWEDDLSCVLEIIKQIISKCPEQIVNHNNEDIYINELKKIEKALTAVNKNPIEKVYEIKKIRVLIRMTAEYMALRENQRYYFDKSWILLRKIILELGKRLKEKKIIDNDENIFHLTIDEIFRTKNMEDASEQIKINALLRSRIYEKNKCISPPYIIKYSDILRLQKKGLKVSYKAIGISPGKAFGPVRVVLTLDDLSKVQKGDIIVVSNFHPSWTPILSIVSGMLMNYGNILSHGAIIAREYRVPVVVFNDTATETFKDGQWIEVDGTLGRIKVPEINTKKESVVL